MRKIGIMGGTFDPIHVGHLLLAEWALDALGLDEVWMVPAGMPYMKASRQILPGAERLHMTELAVRDNDRLKCLDLEVRRQGLTFTHETLEELRASYPRDAFYFIVGADCLFSIETWKSPERIFASCTLVAAVRGESTLPEMEKKRSELMARFGGEEKRVRIILLPFIGMSISSTEIRERIGRGQSVRYLVPDNVLAYIREKGYYHIEGHQINPKRFYREKKKTWKKGAPAKKRSSEGNRSKEEKRIREKKHSKDIPLKKLRREMEKTQDGKRFEHTLGVAYTSAALAMRYDCDIRDAEIAGLLHDCAKCLTDEKRLSICKKHDIPVTSVERENPFLLHAKVGAYLARKKYGVKNQDILNAIRNHTTGRRGMSTLEKIVFVADYIEPGRTHAPNLTEIRKLAFLDLDKAFVRILEDTLDYLKNSGGDIDPMTEETWDCYRK